MKLVKKATKVFVVGFALFTIVRPLTIPRLPPVQFISSAEVVK